MPIDHLGYPMSLFGHSPLSNYAPERSSIPFKFGESLKGHSARSEERRVAEQGLYLSISCKHN